MISIHRPFLTFGKSERSKPKAPQSASTEWTKWHQQLLDSIVTALGGGEIKAKLNNHGDLILIGPNIREEGGRRIRFDIKMDPRGPHGAPHIHFEELKPDPDGTLRFVDAGPKHRYHPKAE